MTLLSGPLPLRGIGPAATLRLHGPRWDAGVVDCSKPHFCAAHERAVLHSMYGRSQISQLGTSVYHSASNLQPPGHMPKLFYLYTAYSRTH